MPRKNKDEADAIVRATDFFKPTWEVPAAKASAAVEESQRRSTPKNGRVDGEG